MSGDQVVFLQEPRQGYSARFLQNGQTVSSSPVSSVQIDPRYPGWYQVQTQSGSVYSGQLNRNLTQVVQPTVATPLNAPLQNARASSPISAPAACPRPTKDKTAAALFAFFLGGLGVHRFYLGQVGLGFLYLCFCWTFIPGFVALIDFIIFLCMSREEFAQKYG